MYSDSQVLAPGTRLQPPHPHPTPSGLTCVYTYNQTAEINCINPGYLFSRIYYYFLYGNRLFKITFNFISK